MTEILFTVDEAPEGGLAARAVGHSIFTEADTLDELRANIQEAVECHFDDPVTVTMQNKESINV